MLWRKELFCLELQLSCGRR